MGNKTFINPNGHPSVESGFPKDAVSFAARELLSFLVPLYHWAWRCPSGFSLLLLGDSPPLLHLSPVLHTGNE